MTEKQKRFCELAERAAARDCTVYSDFLGMQEISELAEMRLSAPVALWGGFDGAERAVACFGDREYFPDNKDYHIKILLIEPVNKKFSDELSHRDFLGSLLGLGLRREMLGDILISANCGYLFCMDTVSEYITENLETVRRTTVRCREIEEIPISAVSEPEETELVVSSCRLDVLISAVYKLSRSQSQQLFLREKVFVNGAVKQSASFVPNEDDKISVRGFGRFIFGGELRSTKKGRTVIRVKIF